MVLSDTSNIDNGLIQACEFWTRHEDTGISGDATLLKVFIGRLNRAFDRVMPLLLSYSDYVRFDDIKHTKAPIGYVNIVSGQADYKITVDGESVDILNISKVRILTSASGTEYKELERMLVNDDRALNAQSPNPSISGIPSHFLEVGSRLYLYPEPNYAASNGIEIFFERQQAYFANSGDDAVEPGIPVIFHELLALIASLDWNRVNRTDDRGLLLELKEEIAKQERNISDLISLRNPTQARFSTVSDNE